MKKNIWSEFAKSYDVVLRNWSLYQELRDKIAHHTNACKVVLDQGCGTGIIATDLAKKRKIIYGIDNNKEMLANAFEKIDDSIQGNMHLQKGDAHNLEYEDDYFDGVVSNNVLFYVKDPIAVLKEAHRALKKEGVFIASGPVPNPDIGKLTQHIIAEFKKKGIYEALQKDLEHFLECSVQLKGTGMPNTYRARALASILTEKVGFDKVLEECESIYLGQSYFVVVEK